MDKAGDVEQLGRVVAATRFLLASRLAVGGRAGVLVNKLARLVPL